MKTWKKRWESELDAKIPALNEQVKNAPIAVSERGNVHKKAGFSEWFYRYKKRILASVAACTAVILGLIFALPLFDQSSISGAVIAIEINPSALFSVDEEDKVIAVVAANADADVILSGGRAEQMEGKTAEQATEIFVDYAARLGYLDLSATDGSAAVRVSGCGNEQMLDSVTSTLKTYFRNKGAYAVVFEESISLAAFGERFSMAAGASLEEFQGTLKESAQLYSEREVDGVEELSLYDLYERTLGQAAELVETQLRKKKAAIVQNAADIRAIEALNEEIKEHKDNPIPFYNILSPKDYWSIKDEKGATEEFKRLLEQMEKLLSDYEAKYGAKIDGTLALYDVFYDYSGVEDVGAEIERILEDFDFTKLLLHYTTLDAWLENVGVDLIDVSGLENLPTTLGDYMQNVKTYLENKFVMMKEGSSETYAKERTQIEEKDYEDFEKGIIEEYGSWDAYWKKLEK